MDNILHNAIRFENPAEEIQNLKDHLEQCQKKGFEPDPNVRKRLAELTTTEASAICTPPSPQTFCDIAAENFTQSPNIIGNCMNRLPIPNSYYVSALTNQDYEKLAVYEGKKIIELNTKIAYDHVLFEKKRDFELMKSRIRIRQAEALEELKTKRGLATETVVEKDGCLVCTYTLPDGPTHYSKALFSVSGLKLKIVISEGRDSEIELLDWMDCPKELRLKSNGNATLFAKELCRAGIGIFVNKNKKLNIMELAYAYLRAHAEIITLSPCFGWNLSADGKWHFSNEQEVVFDDFE